MLLLIFSGNEEAGPSAETEEGGLSVLGVRKGVEWAARRARVSGPGKRDLISRRREPSRLKFVITTDNEASQSARASPQPHSPERA